MAKKRGKSKASSAKKPAKKSKPEESPISQVIHSLDIIAEDKKKEAPMDVDSILGAKEEKPVQAETAPAQQEAKPASNEHTEMIKDIKSIKHMVQFVLFFAGLIFLLAIYNLVK